jgi:hypothetical protein
MPHEQFVHEVWPLWLAPRVDLQDQATAQDVVEQMVAAVDPAWVAAADSADPMQLLHAPSTAAITAQLQRRYGWLTPGQGKLVSLETATVRTFTQLQLLLVLTQRASKHDAFLQAANMGRPAYAGPAADELQLGKLFAKFWKLSWDNKWKELFWRLTVDGRATLARMHMVGGSCSCGVVAPDVRHHFWQCPVAQSIVRLLQSRMPLVTQPLHTVHVWLARSPGGGMHRGVWLVVCQAALMGMDQGRGVLYKWSKQRATPGEQPLPAHLNTAAQRVQAACRVAEAAFWDRLHDFVGLGAYPPVWADHVSPTHPFVCSEWRGEERVLRVNRVTVPA